jgi:glycyl-tRNA synthetase beta chain
MAEFLLEVGTEEIPDWMIANALGDLERRFLEALEKSGLRQEVTCSTGATPRRLVLSAQGLPLRQADREETLSGPPKSVAFDGAGMPTKAAEGFARRAGVAVAEIAIGEDDKLVVTRRVAGRAAADILAEALPDVILGIHFPKTMYWAGKAGPRFIRPIRWLVALLDDKVVPFEIAGVHSSSRTQGHRRLGKSNIEVVNETNFREKLKANFVLVSAAERRQKIETGIASLLPAGKRVRSNAWLLETLVNITEYPTPVLGGFDAAYLRLPEEVLETVMRHHQKYFAVEDAQGRLQPNFVAVANLDGDPDGVIRKGNERVLRARFNDAQFFWESDQKKNLADRVEDLKAVTFQAKLGSYFDKTQQNVALIDAIVPGDWPSEDLKYARRAAELAKCDLTTEMVGEFPELQGVVGGLYARHQGEPQEVADAVYDHYRPAGSDDAIPRSRTGQIVSLADKLTTLGGFFRLGMIPSGSKDPFALRRAAYGVIRILIEGGHRLSISQLCEKANAAEGAAALRDFFVDRLRYYLRDVSGYKYDEVNAVLAASADQPLDAAERAQAISLVRPTPDFEPLATSFKRIKNILRQAGGEEQYAAVAAQESLFEDGAEKDLVTAFRQVGPRVAKEKQEGDYTQALTAIASLRPTVDRFFDDVLVMAKDENVRINRLAFLAHLLREFSTIADFAEIVSNE